MGDSTRIWTLGLLLAAGLGWASAAWAGSYSGEVMAVDQTAGRIVVGDMGPLLANGKSEITRRTIQVTPSTEFAKVKRATGAGPRGWIGEYVETKLPTWSIKAGDFVTVEVQGPAAVKVMLIDTSEP
jgi:hypothetical protein